MLFISSHYGQCSLGIETVMSAAGAVSLQPKYLGTHEPVTNVGWTTTNAGMRRTRLEDGERSRTLSIHSQPITDKEVVHHLLASFRSYHYLYLRILMTGPAVFGIELCTLSALTSGVFVSKTDTTLL